MTIESLIALQSLTSADISTTNIRPEKLSPEQLNLTSTQAVSAKDPASSFADILVSMVDKVEGKIETANGLVQQFAVDDNVPVHRVTFALEEARLSAEMMIQFRTRLVEGYREIMNMQL